MRHRILPEAGVVVITWRGETEDEAILAAYRRLYDDPAWRPGLHELVDVRGARSVGVRGATLEALAELTRERVGPDGPAFRTAVLVSRDVGYGLARMYEAFASDSPEVVKVFRDPVQAAAWVGVDAALLE